MKSIDPEQISFGRDTVLCNKLAEKPQHVVNFICLLAKQYIYCSWCLQKQLDMYKFKRLVFSIRNSEKYIAIKNGCYHQHCIKWGETLPETESQQGQNDIGEYVQNYNYGYRIW